MLVLFIQKKYRKKRIYNLTNEEQIEEEIEIEVEEKNIALDYLLKIIQELPDRYRLVFTMYVLDGYAHKEISEIMEITVGTSKSNLARARKILQTKILDYNKTS